VGIVFAPKIVGQAQIRGEDTVDAIVTTDDGAIPDALFPQMGPKNRLAVVDLFPMEAIPAQAEIDLLPIGGGFLPEMDE
jgi:hypothetical protein